jgi:hypothetical protein
MQAIFAEELGKITKSHSSAAGMHKMKLVTSQMQISYKPEALQATSITSYNHHAI